MTAAQALASWKLLLRLVLLLHALLDSSWPNMLGKGGQGCNNLCDSSAAIGHHQARTVLLKEQVGPQAALKSAYQCKARCTERLSVGASCENKQTRITINFTAMYIRVPSLDSDWTDNVRPIQWHLTRKNQRDWVLVFESRPYSWQVDQENTREAYRSGTRELERTTEPCQSMQHNRLTPRCVQQVRAFLLVCKDARSAYNASLEPRSWARSARECHVI